MQQVLDYVTLVIGSLAGLIIVYGVILGFVELIRAEFRSFRRDAETPHRFEKIRYDIGFHLLLGLEFLIAADIIRTIIICRQELIWRPGKLTMDQVQQLTWMQYG